MKLRVIGVIVLVALLVSATGVYAKKPDVQVLNPDDLYVPDVESVYLAEELGASVMDASPLDEVMPFWADLVNQELVPNDGDGVYVAVLDTGLLLDWPFFFSQANVAWELGKGFTHDMWWDDGLWIGPLRDDRGFLTDLASGHGTHVASTVSGFHYLGSAGEFWVTGVAPEATIIPVLVLDAWWVDTGDPLNPLLLSGGTDEMVAAGINYVADLAPSLDGPVVINMSLGGPSPSALIEAAVDYAISQGVIVVASAGNEGMDGLGYPGGFPQVISAAAGGWTDHWMMGWRADAPEALNTPDSFGNNWQLYLEDFSSRPNKDLGQKHQDLDVTTPGAGIVGPYKSAFSSSVGYYYLWGTSQAAPHVSGMASLVLESHPDLYQGAMEFILKNAARGLPLPADDAFLVDPWGPWVFYWGGGDYGAGFLQADAALRVAGLKTK